MTKSLFPDVTIAMKRVELVHRIRLHCGNLTLAIPFQFPVSLNPK
ncbi:hypothetical protein [Planktothrix sp. FACHB-1355]|nr:hypothetical protein [Planktothrix sp. FACHB-1355]